MNEVKATAINWLWHPYIPYGKITVIQGDGKTTVVLAIAAAEPMSIIFQTAVFGGFSVTADEIGKLKTLAKKSVKVDD